MLLGIPHQIIWTRPAGRVTAGILARMWAACGINRPAERAYAACVIAATGGWLAAAIAIGPKVKPLPQIAVITTMVLGIPWWIHRRRRARVRVERTIAAWPDIAEPIGLAGSRIASVVADAWGWTARVILKKGTSAEDAIAKIPAIESGLGVRRGSVRIFPDDSRADAVHPPGHRNRPACRRYHLARHGQYFHRPAGRTRAVRGRPQGPASRCSAATS